MPKLEFPLTAVIQTLENDDLLVEALFFPEILRYGVRQHRLQEDLQANLQKLLEKLPVSSWHQRRRYELPELAEITLEYAPPARVLAWRTPVMLRFPLLRWAHGADAAHIAYVPALNIEVAATGATAATQLTERLPQHILAALRRRQATGLQQLVWLQRCHELRLAQFTFTASWRTPKQIAAQAAEQEEAKNAVLSEVGVDLTKEKAAVAYETSENVTRLADLLTGRAPRSVLLTGPSGVGKTALLHELVRRRNDFQLSRTPFWATSGARLVAGMTGFGMWQERCQKLWREATKEKAILVLGNLVELMEVGKSVSNSQGVASFLRPYIARGDLLTIAECLPEQLPLIEREDPHLLAAFQQLPIAEPGVEQGKAILLGCALAGKNTEPPLDLAGLEKLDQLHRRYATYSAYPGRPVRFLRNLLQDRETERALTEADVTAAFARETSLPRFLLDETVQLDLTATRAWFAARVIGQPEAVELIVDLLATVKAGLMRPRKPIASLLFIGPTGVGKTELAKALAEFLFRDAKRMVRFDLSEYADALAVNRLIGGGFGAEGLLTAQVREQPFAVVLLDEFEKAHPSFFDLLLQVLGEGRLTDAQGRVADFRNAVVIMTSNLGAASFQRSMVGFAQAAATRQAASQHFTRAVRHALRPELFNRLDRLVPFAPLDETTVQQIAQRELERIKARDGLRYRGVALHVTDEAIQYFAARGYDPRYGARPLKRALERELLAPLSEQLNKHEATTPLAAEVQINAGRVQLNVQQQSGDARPLLNQTLNQTLAQTAQACLALRRNTQALERSPAALELQNDIHQLERLEKRLRVLAYKRPEDMQRLAALPRLKQLAQRLAEYARQARTLEDAAMLAVYGKGAAQASGLNAQLHAAQAEWHELLLAVYALRFKKPDAITLAVFSENAEDLFALAAGYYTVACAHGAQAKLYRYAVHDLGDEQDAVTALPQKEDEEAQRAIIKDPASFLATPRSGVIGLAFGLTGPLVYPRFEFERGLHLFVAERESKACFVHTSEVALDVYQPPSGITRRGALKQLAQGEKRRFYSFKQFLVEDPLLKRKWPWAGRELDGVLKMALEERLWDEAQTLIAE